MLVHELISKLQELDGNSIAVVSGYEGGVTEVVSIDIVRLLDNSDSDEYFGEWELTEVDEVCDISAIYIKGKRH